MPSTIFLAFADSRPGSLPALAEEFERIRDLLMPLDAREYLKLVPYGRISLDQFTGALGSYAGQLSLFHFSGHADGETLALADGPGFGAGLTGLLAGESQLRLVFLNGCATRGHVVELLKAGVKAVIATAAPVKDAIARDFAVAFYRALANKRTVLQAFQFARADVALRHRQTPAIEERILDLRDADAPEEEWPWGLYRASGAGEEARHWRLPYYRDAGLEDFLKEDIRRRVKSNQFIVQVLDRMCQINKDIYANHLVTYQDGQARPVDPSSYLDAIIQNFPWVIGSQIAGLRQHTQPGPARLAQIRSTWQLGSQLLYYILLSDCWEQKVLKKWDLRDAAWVAEFPRSAAELAHAGYADRLLRLYGLMTDPALPRSVELFVPELAEFCRHLADPGHLLYKSRQVLESQAPADPVAACDRAEKALSVFLSETAFLAGYHLLTVRNIYLDNARTRPLRYELELGRLNALVSSSLGLYEDAAYRRKEHFANCKSIVLTPSEKDLQFSLDLSPFLIDKNTFLGEALPDLFLFGYDDGEHLYYLSVNHDFYTALANEKGMDQIHTGMTREDFSNGRNDLSIADDEWDEFFTQATRRPPVRAFFLLEEQYARFRSDFTPMP